MRYTNNSAVTRAPQPLRGGRQCATGTTDALQVDALQQRVQRARDRGLRLAILCKDPSGLLGPILNAASATVAMSATLTPGWVLMRRRVC